MLMKRKPDVVFMQVQTPGIITSAILKQYRGVRFFNFSGDVRPEMPEWYFDVAPYVTTLFTNTDWMQAIRDAGHKAEYFQVGFDHNIYKPEGLKAETKPVVFLGNNHGSQFPLSKLREDMVTRFKEKEWFQVYGRGWGNDVTDLNYRQEKEAAVYRGAKIGINLSHMDLGSYTSDRMFRLMGSGCMCLAYRHKDIRREFMIGRHLTTWSTLGELESSIEFHLNNSDPRNFMARHGCKLVHEKYTWPARMNQLKELI
jgi:spore maturation protein CgeB